jgi:hypothetical protein
LAYCADNAGHGVRGDYEILSDKWRNAKMKHELKTWPEHFRAVIRLNKNERKMVEIRFEGDRKYEVGDTLHLREYDPEQEVYTGSTADVSVSHCLRGIPWVPEGYVAMSIHLEGLFIV